MTQSTFTTASATAAITELYNTIADRSPDARGLTAWAGVLMSGKSLADVRLQFATSQETQGRLARAYQNVYGVPLGQVQLTSYEALIVAGETLDQVTSPWLSQAEINVSNLYESVTSEQAGQAEVATWGQAIMAGVPLQSYRKLFSTSSTTTSQLTQSYESATSQLIGPGALQYAEQLIAGGSTIANIEAQWTPSGNSVATTDQAEITNLYETIGGRNPDPGGLANFTNALEAGNTLQSIRTTFAYGSEAAAQLTQAYENAFSKPISQLQLTQAAAALSGGQSLAQVEEPWYNFISGTSASPQIWLSAVDPYMQAVSAKDVGTTTDFMSLFGSYGTWNSQASVYKISTQFAEWGSATQLQTLFNYLNANHIALAMEGLMLPMTPGSTIGDGVEGFNGVPGKLGAIAERIQSLGGNLAYIAMDEPLYFGHQYAGINAPQESIEAVAQQVAVNIAAVRQVFPNVIVGDEEPTPGTNDLKTWAADFQAATGKPLAFFDADVPWTKGLYLGGLEQVAGELRGLGIAFGASINGNGADTTDAAWVNAAEQRLAAIEADPLIRPEQLVIETWGPNPSNAGPEGTAGSLTNLLGNVTNAEFFYTNSSLAYEQSAMIFLNGPATANVIAGALQPISGLSLSLSGTAATSALQVGVVLLTNGGDLSANAVSGVQITGNDTAALSLLGSISSIQSELANLTYQSSSLGADNLSITVYEGDQAPASYNLSINVQSTSGQASSQIGAGSAAVIPSSALQH